MCLELFWAWISMSFVNHDWFPDLIVMAKLEMYTSLQIVEAGHSSAADCPRDPIFTFPRASRTTVNLSLCTQWYICELGSTNIEDRYVHKSTSNIIAVQSWFKMDIEIHAQCNSRLIKTHHNAVCPLFEEENSSPKLPMPWTVNDIVSSRLIKFICISLTLASSFALHDLVGSVRCDAANLVTDYEVPTPKYILWPYFSPCFLHGGTFGREESRW